MMCGQLQAAILLVQTDGLLIAEKDHEFLDT